MAAVQSNLADRGWPVKVRPPCKLASIQPAEKAKIGARIVRLEPIAGIRPIAMPGEHLDLSSDPASNSSCGGPAADARRFVGIHFICCDVYSRVYINRDQTAYEGNCPKCAKPIRLRIGPGGTDARFFTAG